MGQLFPQHRIVAGREVAPQPFAHIAVIPLRAARLCQRGSDGFGEDVDHVN